MAAPSAGTTDPPRTRKRELMATIEELERLGTYLAEAESKAIRDLVDHLRDAAEALPDGSRLAVVFAEHARQLERHEDLARGPRRSWAPAGGPQPVQRARADARGGELMARTATGSGHRTQGQSAQLGHSVHRVWQSAAT